MIKKMINNNQYYIHQLRMAIEEIAKKDAIILDLRTQLEDKRKKEEKN